MYLSHLTDKNNTGKLKLELYETHYLLLPIAIFEIVLLGLEFCLPRTKPQCLKKFGVVYIEFITGMKQTALGLVYSFI